MNFSSIKQFLYGPKNVLKQSRGVDARSYSGSKARLRPWRNSATLLIVAPLKNSLGFLVMTRSRRSKFMPGGVVFPGGVVSSVDFSKRWLDLYKETKIDLKHPAFFSPQAHLPFIYTDQDEDNESVPNDISIQVSLRITAIREMFEECGILLCKPLEKTKISNSANSYQFEELRDTKKVTEWQEKSRNNSEEFLNLCEKLSCVPDLCALGDWSNWLTPTIYKSSRFNTMFYMVTLPQPLPIIIETFEVENARWETAETLLQDCADKKIALMPPQHYELTRLKGIHNVSDMKKLLWKRKELGIGLKFPFIITVKDGILRLLEGDYLYPESPDFYNRKEEMWSQTLDEYQNSTMNLHRAVVAEDGTVSYIINNTQYGELYT